MNFYFVNEKTQYENSGDALINRELITLLRKSGKVFANCPENCPDSFINELELNEEEIIRTKKSLIFALKIIRKAIRSIFSHDSVYVFGGLGDANGKTLSSALKDLVVFLTYLLYRALGIDIIVIGKSFGKQGKINKITTTLRSFCVNEYYVRDLKSLEYCHSIGIKKAKYCPDLSWQMESVKKEVNQGGVVLATFRIPPHVKNAERYEQRLIEKLEIILAEIHNQLKIDLDLVLAYQVKKDIKVMRRVKKAVEMRGGGTRSVVLIEEKLTLQTMPQFYGSGMFHISNRLHSLLYGYKYGSLPIALIDQNHRKIESTFSDNNISNLIVDVLADDCVTKERVDDIILQRDKMFKELQDAEEKNRIELESVFEHISGL